MKEYLTALLKRNEYPEEAAACFLSAYAAIAASEEASRLLSMLLDGYRENLLFPFEEHLPHTLVRLGELTGVHERTLVSLLFLCLSRELYPHYEAAGYERELCDYAVIDIKNRVMEGWAVYGLWGTASIWDWHVPFFRLQRFSFGQLQFDFSTFHGEYHKNGLDLSPESRVLKVHIPNTGKKLDIDAVKQNLMAAGKFYERHFEDEPIVFYCRTWLFFREHMPILKPSSTILAFYRLFEIVEEGYYPNYSEAWRIFNTRELGNPDALPEGTSLQKFYKEKLQRGEPIGWSAGIYVYRK